MIINGIYYNLYYNSKTEAEVTWNNELIRVFYTGDVVIPESVTYDDVVYSVTSIGYYAFYQCSNLTSVTIPDGVTSIADGAFSGCSGLTSITIPNSVTTIGTHAFQLCEGLTSVTIGSGVTSIGDDIFYGCISLLDMFCYAENVPNLGNDAFNKSNIANATLHVPAGSVGAYQTASPWNGFKKIVALEEEAMDGDLNGDDVVDANDVVEIVKMIAAGDVSAAGDLNGDGKVDVADVVMLLNIIAGK